MSINVIAHMHQCYNVHILSIKFSLNAIQYVDMQYISICYYVS